MMLEDDFSDVIRKAIKGLALSPGEASLRAGIQLTDLQTLLHGQFSEAIARRLAPVLELDADALANHPRYKPQEHDVHGIQHLDLPFHDGQVNAWLLSKEGTTILFDTGFLSNSCSDALRDLGVENLSAVFITHHHPDHLGGLKALGQWHCPTYFPSSDATEGTIPLNPDDVLSQGRFRITAIDLAGHCDGALGYLVEGMEQPVCVVGDALFAGSIGGCSPETYHTALSNLRRGVLPLPKGTILLPGHGPATTVGEELTSNPFLAS
jgi:hydroxyacylglutathione hydrolase